VHLGPSSAAPLPFTPPPPPHTHTLSLLQYIAENPHLESLALEFPDSRATDTGEPGAASGRPWPCRNAMCVLRQEAPLLGASSHGSPPLPSPPPAPPPPGRRRRVHRGAQRHNRHQPRHDLRLVPGLHPAQQLLPAQPLPTQPRLQRGVGGWPLRCWQRPTACATALAPPLVSVCRGVCLHGGWRGLQRTRTALFMCRGCVAAVWCRTGRWSL
jgi:hypothetical protein